MNYTVDIMTLKNRMIYESNATKKGENKVIVIFTSSYDIISSTIQ